MISICIGVGKWCVEVESTSRSIQPFRGHLEISLLLCFDLDRKHQILQGTLQEEAWLCNTKMNEVV